jgi:hypothetical protein
MDILSYPKRKSFHTQRDILSISLRYPQLGISRDISRYIRISQDIFLGQTPRCPLCALSTRQNAARPTAPEPWLGTGIEGGASGLLWRRCRHYGSDLYPPARGVKGRVAPVHPMCKKVSKNIPQRLHKICNIFLFTVSSLKIP